MVTFHLGGARLGPACGCRGLSGTRGETRGPRAAQPAGTEQHGPAEGTGTAGAGLPAVVSATAGEAHPGAGDPPVRVNPDFPRARSAVMWRAVAGHTPHQPARHPSPPRKDRTMGLAVEFIRSEHMPVAPQGWKHPCGGQGLP